MTTTSTENFYELSADDRAAYGRYQQQSEPLRWRLGMIPPWDLDPANAAQVARDASEALDEWYLLLDRLYSDFGHGDACRLRDTARLVIQHETEDLLRSYLQCAKALASAAGLTRHFPLVLDFGDITDGYGYKAGLR